MPTHAPGESRRCSPTAPSFDLTQCAADLEPRALLQAACFRGELPQQKHGFVRELASMTADLHARHRDRVDRVRDEDAHTLPRQLRAKRNALAGPTDLFGCVCLPKR